MKKPIKKNIYADVKTILEHSRASAVSAVNFSMVIAYWQIGKRIIEEEQSGKRRAGYGEFLLNDLSGKLTKSFGQGFTYRNLAAMRQFFLTFPIVHALRAQSSSENTKAIVHAPRAQLKKAQTSSNQIPHTLRRELSWTHYRMLIRVENPEARNYYMDEAANENWSTRTLERQINTLYFERLLSSKKQKSNSSKNF